MLLHQGLARDLGDEPSAGNVTKITRKVGNDAPFDVYASCLKYNRRGELWFVTEKSWQEDEFGVPSNEQTLKISEFRGGGRARYLTRQREPLVAGQRSR